MEEVPDFHNTRRNTGIIIFILCLTNIMLAIAIYNLSSDLDKLRHRVYLLEHNETAPIHYKYL